MSASEREKNYEKSKISNKNDDWWGTLVEILLCYTELISCRSKELNTLKQNSFSYLFALTRKWNKIVTKLHYVRNDNILYREKGVSGISKHESWRKRRKEKYRREYSNNKARREGGGGHCIPRWTVIIKITLYTICGWLYTLNLMNRFDSINVFYSGSLKRQ